MFKNINKKTILVVLAGLALLSIAFIFYQSQVNKKVSPAEKFQQNLNITNYFPGTNLQIENDIKSSDFNFPNSLPYLQQTGTSPLTDSQSRTIAKNLGFTSDPDISNDAQNGEVLIWNSDQYSLIATPSINIIQLSSNSTARVIIQNAINKKLSDADYQSLGQKFLTDKIGLDSSKASFTGFSYYKTANGVEYLAKTTKADAEIIQLNYTEGPSTYPITTTNPDEPQIYIQLLKDGTVISFKGNLGLTFQNSPNEYPLLTFSQFSQNLSKSIIVSLNNNSVNLPDLSSSSLSDIKVNKVSLVYLIDTPNAATLQPVFLIQGTVFLKGVSGIVDIEMYLPAFAPIAQP